MNTRLELGEMFHQVLELCNEGIFIVQNGRVRQCNGFLDAAGGYLPEEVEETLFASFFHEKSIGAIESLYRQCPARPLFATLPELVLMSKNGRRLSVRLKAQACRFSGRPAVLVVLSQVKKQAGGRTVFDAIPDAHLLLEEESPASA